jgi:hypothetical protein
MYGNWHAHQAGASQAGASQADQRQVVLPRREVDEVAVEPTAAFTNDEDPAAPDSGEAEVETGDGREESRAESMNGMHVEAPGEWEIACRIKGGSELMFDRASLREYGAVTLFRWSAPHARTPGGGQRVFTGVANCREKTIEPAWPGKSRDTRAGTCGRGLIEAVCAAADELFAPAHGRRASPPGGAAHRGVR